LARRNLRRFRDVQPRAAVWLDAWDRVVDAGPESILEAMTSTSPAAIDLRHNPPFMGLLSDDEQRAVIAAFAEAQRAVIAAFAEAHRASPVSTA
ncbi:MAG: hypothetical protein ABIQ58_09570, partial [Candidatus Limnocylindrales bacterium]